MWSVVKGKKKERDQMASRPWRLGGEPRRESEARAVVGASVQVSPNGDATPTYTWGGATTG